MDHISLLQNLPDRLNSAGNRNSQTPTTRETRGAGTGQGESNKLEVACQEFESLFMYYMLKEMRSTIDKSGYFHGGKAEEIYTSMLDSHLARKISVERGVGIAKILQAQLNQHSGKAPGNR